MDQQKMLANELSNMLTENKLPITIEEDIHEICRGLQSGEISVNDLKEKDPFVVNAVQEAMDRINKPNS
ncbi:hypothetical protein H8R29_19730 [Priestia megaterium]|jgi:hypothetical protein|uniref:Uncharacterized protein n=2 Tax=Priestia megaterium TaxID=1404 RepID=A0A109FWG1_PRIMG|nr:MULTISPECIES: hypothetical protein [Priestia]MCJ7990179.1 hypothetical protein [Priestia sp. OVS21]AJI24055.1 hypothetical protein BG04_674 [Priestia megaterium NBRC 15308 = ATCC 14581]AYE49921.1 hypothetical protein OEA_09015 [Priestia megaterium NCT-2]KFN06169.1 hypothetical protein DJ91_4323 [Priestia megaterium]KGJ81340.1 hypothetical protein BMT_19175 [Priestia megaterium NBRC 15308 = ATCC 14581]